MTKPLLLTTGLMALVGHLSNAQTQGTTPKAIEIGHTVTIQSRTLNESRRILIHVPTNRKNASAKYPVLYVLDGDEYFLPAVGIVSYLTTYDYLPEMLVVGIPHADRFRDYTPTRDARAPSGGGVDRFLEFVMDEVFPYIDTHHRTQPYRILSGHSLGGLCALYAFARKPEMFNAYVAISPSVYWDNGVLLTIAEKALKDADRLKKSVHISVEKSDDGLHEKTNGEFARVLSRRAVRDLRFGFDQLDGETHTSLWVRGFNAGLRFVSPFNVPETVLNGGLGAVLRHFNDLGLEMSENLLVRLALDSDETGKLGRAIEILEYAVSLYPKSADLYHGLGDIYRKDLQHERALAAYEKGLKTAQAGSDRALVELFTQHIDEIRKAMKK